MLSLSGWRRIRGPEIVARGNDPILGLSFTYAVIRGCGEDDSGARDRKRPVSTSPDLPGLAVMDWQRGSARTGTDQAVRILHHRPAPLPS